MKKKLKSRIKTFSLLLSLLCATLLLNISAQAQNELDVKRHKEIFSGTAFEVAFNSEVNTSSERPANTTVTLTAKNILKAEVNPVPGPALQVILYGLKRDSKPQTFWPASSQIISSMMLIESQKGELKFQLNLNRANGLKFSWKIKDNRFTLNLTAKPNLIRKESKPVEKRAIIEPAKTELKVAPKAKVTPEPIVTPTPKPKASATVVPSPSPSAKPSPKPTATKQVSPKKAVTETPTPSLPNTPKPTASPTPTPKPIATPTLSPKGEIKAQTSLAPASTISEDAQSDPQVGIEQIAFEYDRSGKTALIIRHEGCQQGALIKISKEVYHLELENCALLNHQVRLPYFAPRDFKGFKTAQAKNEAGRIIVEVTTEPGTFLELVAHNSELLLYNEQR
jgi:hypothetical protein